MSSFDKVKMTLPDNTEFVGTGDLSVNITQTPKWLFDGFSEVFAASDQITGSNGALTEQVFQGAGSKVRAFEISFVQWQGSTETWGSANSDDDIIVKMQELDHALASTRITSDKTATLEFGEYSTGGSYSPVDVVPGESNLTVDFGDAVTAFEPQLRWLDAVDLTQTLHD